MTSSVKLFKSTDTAAPTLNGVAGSLVSLLNACLVTGYGAVALTSLSVSGGVATANVDTGHGFADYTPTLGAVLRIEGAADAALNGDWRCRVVDANTFTFDCPGVADGAASGSISAKRAAAGWERAHVAGDGQRAAFRSVDPAATGLYLYVDDTGTDTGSDGQRTANVRGYESMGDLDTGLGPFPTEAQDSPRFCKSYHLDSAAQTWTLIADGRLLYLFGVPHGSYPEANGVLWFGDLDSYRPGDAYHCVLVAQPSSQRYNYPPGYYGKGAFVDTYSASQAGHYIARAHTQIGSANQFGKLGDYSAMDGTIMGASGLPYPHPVDNGLHCVPVRVAESGVLRGVLSGLYCPLHARPLAHWATVTDIDGLPGVELLAVSLSSSNSWGGPYAQALIDITGPWS